jgi:hypothetical protein
MKVWKNIRPIYIIFDELGFEPLFEMPLDDRTDDNFGNNYLVKAVACSNDNIDKVIPFLVKDDPILKKKIRDATKLVISYLQKNTHIKPLLLTKIERGQITNMINVTYDDDCAITHSIILGYNEVSVLLIICGVDLPRLVSRGILEWAGVTKNEKMGRFIRYALKEYYVN